LLRSQSSRRTAATAQNGYAPARSALRVEDLDPAVIAPSLGSRWHEHASIMEAAKLLSTQ